MQKEGLDVYMPLVDDFGIDAVIRKPSGEFIEIQIKARSKDVVFLIFKTKWHTTLASLSGNKAHFYAVIFLRKTKNLEALFFERFQLV